MQLYMENLENPNNEDQFVKQAAAAVNTFGTKYDIKSIMQYEPNAFAKPGRLSIN